MNNPLSLIQDKILSRQAMRERVFTWKNTAQKIVFTNGCFDLVHLGHITYLAEAAALGNKLIIGLNTDSSVCRLKGPERPVNGEEVRAALLASFFFVDAVVLFSEETPRDLIVSLMPDVLVKGGDYTVENVAGAAEVIANGGEVKLLDFLPGYSSSAIVEKIRKT